MIRSALRALGYVVSELIPSQAIRCALDRDYSRAVTRAAADVDGAEQLAEERYEPSESIFRSAGQTYETGLRPKLSTSHGALCRFGHWLHFGNSCAACGCNNTNLPAVSAESAAGSPEAVCANPPAPASGHLTVDWLVPAICEVLSEHQLERRDRTVGRYVCRNQFAIETIHATFGDDFEWRKHVAPLIAAHILKAITGQ